MESRTEKKVYYYPEFVPGMQKLMGLYITEWFIVAAPAILALIFFRRIFIVLIGLIFGGGLWFIFVRQKGERSNLAHQLFCVFNFYSEQQKYRKMGRSEIKGNIGTKEEQIEAPQSSKSNQNPKKKKPKKNKKAQKKKDKYMEDLFPFRSIHQGYVEMENGVYFLYFNIQANNLDLLSETDLESMISTFSRNLDTNKYDISFFIQDSIFKVRGNIEEIDRCKKIVKHPFLRMLLDQTKDMIKEEKDDMNKKANYLRIRLSPKKMKVINIEEVQSRVIKNFNESLNLVIATRDEIKQMLAIYGNRIFCEDLPDTELPAQQKEEKKALLRKKKIPYRDTQLPGIYTFKNLIVPINAEFHPSNAKLGNNIIKTYAINSFLGSTQYTNLLSRVCTLKGVTTMIYLSDLKLARFRENASLQLKAKDSTVNGSLDEIDTQLDKNNLEGTYKRARAERQRMYYLTVYFQLCAKTKKEFKNLEELFLQEINDQNISIDGLKTQQKEGYLTVSPIGHDHLSDYTKQNIPSESVSNLYPFNEPAILDPTGLPIGNVADSKLMMLFDPFMYRGSNYNMLILGQSGQGKTVLMMLLMQICACKHYYIRNIDFEGVYVNFIEKIGGINVDVSGGNEFCINPLQIRIPDEVKTNVVDDYISEVLKWIAVYKPSWTSDDLDLFQDCLKKTYDRFHITGDSDIRTLTPKQFPILSDVLETIIQERKHAGDENSIAGESMYQKLQRGLLAATGGADACMFNRHTNLGDVDINAKETINFDMSKIMSSNTSRKLAQMMNIFTFNSQFINANMKSDKKIVIGMDELDKCLTPEYMVIIEILNDYERRSRKRNASFIKATQMMEELDTQIAEMEAKVKSLFSQPAIKYLFYLGSTDYDKAKKMLDLTDTEIERLKTVRNGKCLMKVNQAIYDLEVMMPLWFKDVKSDIKKKKGSADA